MKDFYFKMSQLFKSSGKHIQYCLNLINVLHDVLQHLRRFLLVCNVFTIKIKLLCVDCCCKIIGYVVSVCSSVCVSLNIWGIKESLGKKTPINLRIN